MFYQAVNLVLIFFKKNWQPYITKAYFETPNPPVNLKAIAIGDGTIGAGEVFQLAPTVHAFLYYYPSLY